MKKIFIASMLIPFVTISSCQKQDSAAEQRLAQQKVEMDAREEAFNEREKELNLRETALNERENALAKREKAAVNARAVPPDSQSQNAIRDAAEAKTERDRKIQQLPPEIRALVPDPSQANVPKDRMPQDPLAQRQGARQESQNKRQDKWQTQKGSKPGLAVPPPAEDSSLTSSPAFEGTSPAPSPTP